MFRACHSPSNRCQPISALRCVCGDATTCCGSTSRCLFFDNNAARLRLDFALLSTSSGHSSIHSLLLTTSFQLPDYRALASLPTRTNRCSSFVSGYGSLGGCGRWRYVQLQQSFSSLLIHASHWRPQIQQKNKTNGRTASVTHSSGRTDGIPDLRIVHYNDVYHVEPGSREPVGGVARFQTLCNQYAKDERYAGQPELLTLFSGDAFNPSLESSVTKGKVFYILHVWSIAAVHGYFILALGRLLMWSQY
jgi:hypothetical protein